MNYRNGIAILLLLTTSAIAEEGFNPLRVISINETTIEHHLHTTAPADWTQLSGLQVNPTYQVYHYFPGAQIFVQTVESVDMDTRTVKMFDGTNITTKVLPADKTTTTNIGIVSLFTGEIWWGTIGSTLSNRLTIIQVNEAGGIIAECPETGRVIIPKVTVPELQVLGKQKSQQGGPAYPPQGVGSADP